MEITTFTSLLENSKKIKELQIASLKKITEEFPYFQIARSLYLKGLKQQDSFRYNNELKRTAAYTADRAVLFNYITSSDFNFDKNTSQQTTNDISQEIATEPLLKPTKETIEKSLKEDIEPNKKAEEAVKIKEVRETEEAEEIGKVEKRVAENKKELAIGKPLVFLASENYSFEQWLQLPLKKSIVRTHEKPKGKITKKLQVIDTFIQNNPKISVLPKDKKFSVTIRANKSDASLMTETLARVYLEQKKYDNAIQAYRILSLKYPEKSGFFADQIKRIQTLQNNKL